MLKGVEARANAAIAVAIAVTSPSPSWRRPAISMECRLKEQRRDEDMRTLNDAKEESNRYEARREGKN